MSGSRENMMDNRWQNGLPRPIAFVFSGGAALGAIQVGMLQALTAVNLQPDIVVGTSAGALNGTMVAERGLAPAVETLTTLWRSFTRQDFFPGGRLAQVRQLPVLYLPTPCPMSRSTLDFSESGRLMVEAQQMARRFLETAVMPSAGQMCGAPHFHDDEPMLQLVQMASAS